MKLGHFFQIRKIEESVYNKSIINFFTCLGIVHPSEGISGPALPLNASLEQELTNQIQAYIKRRMLFIRDLWH